MRAALIIGAVVLTACNPPVDNTPGEFGTFNASVIGDNICHFGTSRDATEAMLAIDRNENGLAFARFKGETLKLMPLEPLVVDKDGTLSGVFGAIDYPQWQITLTGRDLNAANLPPSFGVDMTLSQGGQTVAQSPQIVGQCRL